MKKHVRSTKPLPNEPRVRVIAPTALAYAQGGDGQVYPGTEYDVLPGSPYRS
jgi:hypothetical protein